MATEFLELLESAPYRSRDGRRCALIHPSNVEPGRLQATRFDADGPIGHATHDTEAGAVKVLGEYAIYPTAERAR